MSNWISFIFTSSSARITKKIQFAERGEKLKTILHMDFLHKDVALFLLSVWETLRHVKQMTKKLISVTHQPPYKRKKRWVREVFLITCYTDLTELQQQSSDL